MSNEELSTRLNGLEKKINEIDVGIELLKDHLPHPYELLIDRRILKKVEQVYLLHYSNKALIRFQDSFKPISIRNLRLDNGEPVAVWNGQYVHLKPENETQEARLRAYNDVVTDIAENGEDWQNNLFTFLHDVRTWQGWIHENIIITLVILTVLLLILTSFKEYEEDYTLNILELIATAYFTFEYLAQWMCVRNRCMYFSRVGSILDLLAIAPKYVELAVPSAPTGILSALKIFRLVRLSKMPIFQNPYADIVLQSIVDMMWGSGAIITLYVLILVILGGVFLVEYASEDEVMDATVGMWYTFATIFSGENQLEEMNFLTYLLMIIQIVMGVLIVSSVINTLGEYHHHLIDEFENSTRLIGIALYNFYAKQYSDKKKHKRAFLYNITVHDVKHLYDMVDDELLTADCKPITVQDPGPPDIALISMEEETEYEDNSGNAIREKDWYQSTEDDAESTALPVPVGDDDN